LSGGDRFATSTDRPVLAALGAALGKVIYTLDSFVDLPADYHCDRFNALTAAIEMLHKASLLHDDLIDGDDYRRGKPAFHCRHGLEKTIIAGDLLVALAGARFQRFAGPELTGRWLELYRKLCYGEFLDVISGRTFSTQSDLSIGEWPFIGKSPALVGGNLRPALSVVCAPEDWRR